jgi:hypothetical protein
LPGGNAQGGLGFPARAIRAHGDASGWTQGDLDVQRYIDVLDTVAGGRERWAVAVIAGPGPGKCLSIFGTAHEGRRLKRFVADVGTNAVFSSICEGDLASALTRALDTFGAACDVLSPVP